MKLELIQQLLASGRLLHCPICDYFHKEGSLDENREKYVEDMCDIICCENPFEGPESTDVEGYLNLLTKSEFSKILKK